MKHAGVIDRLEELFPSILVPPAVMRELCVKEKEHFQELKLLKVVKPANAHVVNVLKPVVDEGEAEAIALALEKNVLLIIDDLKGRKTARRLGLRVIGTLGLLKVRGKG